MQNELCKNNIDTQSIEPVFQTWKMLSVNLKTGM